MKLSIVYSSHLGDLYDKKFEEHIHSTIGLPKKDYEILKYENFGEFSLSEIYNRGLKDSKSDIVIFTHNDLEFDTKKWGVKLNSIIRKNNDYGIIGVAGTTHFMNTGVWWQDKNCMYGTVNHQQDGKKWTSTYSPPFKGIKDMVVVDGLFMVVNKKNITKNFDERFNGFHFYDISFCYRNFIEGVPIGITNEILLTHNSVGETNNEWEENRKLFLNIYKHEEEIIYNNVEPDTYIFCHDQDIILELEKQNNFNSLETYNYVFLGNGDTDKLKNLLNIIYAKEEEGNLEEHKYLCAYSGWYLLWKRNLIKSNYVTLLEYDTKLGNFSPILDKYLEYSDVFGYVPFDVNNFHFIKNPDWTEELFNVTKKIHKVNLEKITKDKISQEHKHWISTSNCTLSTSFFNEYMKWLEPIIHEMKDYKNVGHALERCLTFYCFYKNKKVVFLNGILQHYQMDSHKTQGHKVTHEIVKKKKSKGVAFSLWGDNPMYTKGAIENAKLMKKIYPEWDMVLYYNDTVDKNIILELSKLGVKLNKIKEEKGYHWRFYAADEYETVIFRDCDSRISEREKIAVDEWLSSDKMLHVIRDHPHHKIPYGVNKPAILAGMWGIKNANFNMKELLNMKNTYEYGEDQKMLLTIYEKFEKSRYIHDTFGNGNKIKHTMKDYHFIGERFNEENNRFDDYKILERL